MSAGRPAAGVCFRRSPHVVAYWRGPELVVENYRSGVLVSASPETLTLLTALAGWQDAAALAERFPNERPASLARAVERLLDATLIERSDNRAKNDDRAIASWASWHPAAALLHFSSKDLPYQEFPRSQRALRTQAKRQPRPPAVKRYPRARRTALAAPRIDGEFPNVLLDRRTWRRFGRGPIPLEALATLLGLSCGVQHWVDVPGVGRLPMKTYPSGGAQHPLEVYVLARRVSGLAPGLYHYASDTHELELIRQRATARQIASYLPTQPWYGSAAALLIITAVFPRMQWKYPYSRAYRAVLAEAGHLCQTLCLTATWLKLAPFCSMALADSRIERDLGVDGFSESVIYAAGVGGRPSANWAPWPTRRQLRRTRNRLGS